MHKSRVVVLICGSIMFGCSDEPPSSLSGQQMPGSTAGSNAAAGVTAPAAGQAGSMQAGAGGRSAPSGASGASGMIAASGRGASGGGGGAGVAGASIAGASGATPPAAGGGGAMPLAGASGSAGASGMAAGGAGRATEMPTCMKGAVKASEVVFIGESFIAAGSIPRMTSELARKAGTIGAGESYRSLAVSGTQLTTGAIPMQYENAKRGGPVKVVLMDGGGNDLLLGGRCTNGYDAPCKEIVDVVLEMFATFKMDGVKDVVYFFYPDPMGIGAQIKAPMDILRPEMKKACDEATDVRCIWVDQRESWEGNYERFTSDGIHPTEAGSMASAQQIWDAMVAKCVAQ